MRTATQTMKFTALYERLSRDDELILVPSLPLTIHRAKSQIP